MCAEKSEFAIELENLTKDFRLGFGRVRLRAVHELSLKVPVGSIYGLIGPNGSGKSTVLKIILDLLSPTFGTCRIFGQSQRNIKTRRYIGFLPEAPYFYRYLTGRELLKFYADVTGVPRKKIKGRIHELLELVDLKQAGSRQVGTYSKGMLQRIGIAQALIHDPKLLILDEPTAGMDPIGAEVVGKMILGLRDQGKTILLCSHLLSQVESICDRVGLMHQGHLIQEGKLSDLLRQNNLKRILVRNLSASNESVAIDSLKAHGIEVDGIEEAKIGLQELFISRTLHQDAQETSKPN